MYDTPPRRFLTHLSLLILLALAVLWFAQLNIRHLIASDEGRYAEMAREMFITRDWVTPRYNGYKYFEKPPLQTWCNALTYAWFGIGDWQARLYTALTGFAGVALLGFTTARLFNPLAGLMAATVLAASPYWYLMGHFDTLDMGLSFWMEVSLCAMLLAQRPGLSAARARAWMWLCWAGMALAVLSKGLIGILLPGGVLVLYTLLMRDWALWRRLYPASGAVVFAVIAAPWFVLVQQRNPEFFNFFFVVQQFQRYLTPEQNRPGHFYYFVPVLAVGFLPWLSTLPQSVRHALRAPRQPNGFAPLMMCLVWIVFIFLFFSASHSKLVSYVLPVTPALALLIGLYLPSVTRQQWRAHLVGYGMLYVAACFGTWFLARLGDARTPNALYREYQILAYAALASAALLTALAGWVNRRDARASILVFALAWLALASIAGDGHEAFGRQSSGALLAPAVKAELRRLPPDTPFYAVDVLDHTLPFYVGHTTIMVQNANELSFGVAVEPHKWIPTLSRWIEVWRAEDHALALMQPSLYERLREQGLPMRVVARDTRRVVVSRTP